MTERQSVNRQHARRSTWTAGACRTFSTLAMLTLVACSDPPTTASDDDLGRSGVDEALIDAAWDNDVAGAEQLIADGGDVNHQDGTRQSAYLIATSEGHLELLELTLRNGADVTSLDSFNGTGLIRAAERGHAAVVGRLLQAGIDVDHVNNLGWSALHEAIILGSGDERYVDTVRLLVAGRADVSLPTGGDMAPLQLAFDHGQDVIVATIEAALDTDSPREPNDALLDASSSGDADRAALAIAAGADIETRDADLRTPRLLAAANGHDAVVRLLVAFGADAEVTDD